MIFGQTYLVVLHKALTQQQKASEIQFALRSQAFHISEAIVKYVPNELVKEVEAEVGTEQAYKLRFRVFREADWDEFTKRLRELKTSDETLAEIKDALTNLENKK